MRDNELNSRLRKADPIVREGELSSEQIEVMRRQILATFHSQQAVHDKWLLRPAVAIVGLLLLVIGLAVRMGPVSRIETPSQPAGEVTHVQFDTPSGTRIVWTLNPNLTF
jgi:hypothetical protein